MIEFEENPYYEHEEEANYFWSGCFPWIIVGIVVVIIVLLAFIFLK